MYDEMLIKMMGEMKNMDLEHFGGTVDATFAHDWKNILIPCLETIKFPLRLCLNIAELYLRGDAAAW